MGDLELKGLQRNPIELYNEEEEQESYENTTHHHKYAYYRNYLILICLIFSLSAMQYGQPLFIILFRLYTSQIKYNLDHYFYYSWFQSL